MTEPGGWDLLFLGWGLGWLSCALVWVYCDRRAARQREDHLQRVWEAQRRRTRVQEPTTNGEYPYG